MFVFQIREDKGRQRKTKKHLPCLQRPIKIECKTDLKLKGTFLSKQSSVRSIVQTFNMATLFNNLSQQDQLQAVILFYKNQIRVARKELRKTPKQVHESAPDASTLPHPSFFTALPASPPAADHLDWLEITPSVAETHSEGSSEHVAIEIAPAEEAVSTAEDDAASSTKSKKHGPHRNFRHLANILADSTPIFIESKGDRWDGVFRVVDGKCSFIFDGADAATKRVFQSPAAVTKAHASRITASHPKATKPGSGWEYITIAATKKTLGEVYDAANSV